MSDDRQGWLPPVAAADPPQPYPPAPPPGSEARERRPRRGGLLGRLFAPLLVLVAAAGKLKALLLLLPKAKFLITSGSMLVSVVAYATIWPWQFAIGFVLLLLVHEYGHVIQLRREGVKDASAPVFIPFLGALIWSKSLGGNAAAEARVGLAGPVIGSLGALACVGLHALTGNELFQALAFTGFFLNLFNLLPFGFLDGARAAGALSPYAWLLGVFGMVILVLTFPNPIIILIALLGGFETYRRFKDFRAGGEAVRAYYAIARRDRIIVATVYLGLIIALVIGMDLTHLDRDL